MENNILNGENSENLNQENSSFFDEKVSSSNSNEEYPKIRFSSCFAPLESKKLSDFFEKVLTKNSDGKNENVICNSARLGLIPQREYFDKDIANIENTLGYYIIKQNDFVYNPRKSLEAPYGPVSIYNRKEDGIVSPLYLVFRPVREIVPQYFEQYFKSSAWHRYIYMEGDSGARHDRVSIKDATFFSMPIRIPNKSEQNKIADFLSLIDKRIEKQRQLVENLKKYKRGLLSAIFERKICFDNHNSWSECLLSKILNERKTYCEKDGTYEHATLSKDGVSGKTERYERDFLVSTENKKYKITHWGDICYNPANLKFGVICLNTYGSAIFSPIYVTFEISEDLNKKFIGYCLTRNEFIRKALKYQQGTVYEQHYCNWQRGCWTCDCQIQQVCSYCKIAYIDS